jgi:rhodanese-related sulfurtransferase
MIPCLSVQQLQEKLTQGEEVCLLDVRQDWEFDLCSLPDSLHIPLGNLENRLDEIPLSQSIVVICHHGVRSQQGALRLLQSGIKNVFSLTGGIDAWAKHIDPNMGFY